MGLDALLENQLGHGPKFQKLHIYSLSTPGGQHWVYFCSTGSGFRDMGRFSKLPYLARNLSIGQSSRSYTQALSTPGGWNVAYFLSMGSGFQDTGRLSKLLYLGLKTWPLVKVPEVTYIVLSFYPMGSKLSLFWPYEHRFPKYGQYFHNCHIWAWNLAIGQSFRSCTYSLFLPQWVENEFIFALRAAVSEIWADFQNCHIWAWNLAIGQSVSTYTS